MSTPFFDPYEPIKKPMEFSMDDPSLHATDSPVEIACVLRMYRTGWPGPRIMQLFGIRQQTLQNLIKLAQDTENEARRLGREVYAAVVPKGTT